MSAERSRPVTGTSSAYGLAKAVFENGRPAQRLSAVSYDGPRVVSQRPGRPFPLVSYIVSWIFPDSVPGGSSGWARLGNRQKSG